MKNRHIMEIMLKTQSFEVISFPFLKNNNVMWFLYYELDNKETDTKWNFKLTKIGKYDGNKVYMKYIDKFWTYFIDTDKVDFEKEYDDEKYYEYFNDLINNNQDLSKINEQEVFEKIDEYEPYGFIDIYKEVISEIDKTPENQWIDVYEEYKEE